MVKIKLGFVGMGIMGQPMALNLLKAGFELTVFNRHPEKCGPLTAEGASQASSPKKLALQSDVVLTIVSDTADVESVLFGEEGISEGLKKGSVVIDMSTISPTATINLATRLREQGCEMLDAPVSGGESGAKEGTLAIMVGGNRDVFEKCLLIFRALGKTVVYTGPNGNGQKTKLVNQVIGALNILGVAEGLRLAKAADLDLTTTLSVVSGGAASSWMLKNLGPKILQSDFTPGFTLTLHQKDLRLAREFIQQTGQDFPGANLVYSLFTQAIEKGLGNQGNQGLINLWK